ncbi:MAG: GTPase Era [Saprospiraceae bacterium]|nr:GTPase Era [Saprospiraceae bacterium]
MHKSGFVNIIGRPNVGKSTLMNALVGERMSIITAKPQTTRHRIIGILSGEDFQIVFSDTPGFIDDPTYKMQEIMNRFVHSTFEDADLMLFVTEPGEDYEPDDALIKRLQSLSKAVPLFLVINKVDLIEKEEIEKVREKWASMVDFAEIQPISALHRARTDQLLERILEYLPEGPVYYPKDQLTDRPERFFVSEIIREKILLLYHQEIPYSCEVIVVEFKETETGRGEPLVRIRANIYVARKSQKAILIGKNGSAIKQLGTEARKDIETFLQKKVFLELHVKVRENWRDDDRTLRHFGYQG